MKMEFKIESKYKPFGDQPKAISEIVSNFEHGVKEQILLGATGTGKTFTVANVIAKLNKPTLVLAHNKTLAGQLYSELKNLFPNNHVEYFISYYDYYQPEAYVVTSDTYIEKDAKINDEIDQMRHSAVSSILEYRDTIVVSSVSCIYGIGDINTYANSLLTFKKGNTYNIKEVINKLISMQYERGDLDFKRSTFRVRGDTLEIIPASVMKEGIRVEFDFDTISRIRLFDPLTGNPLKELEVISVFPASFFITSPDKLQIALRRIRDELEERKKYFIDRGLLLEEERIRNRTEYDLEMLSEMGTCAGVENYSYHLSLRKPGDIPECLLDFFKKDFLLVVDESHVTIPQVRGMYNGDHSRKESLVNYGFRLPSALENRPLRFKEFEDKLDQVLYMSATPGDYEMEKHLPITEQIIRPTGLVDPKITVRPTLGQIDDLFFECKKRIASGDRVLITTLTIKMSEDLTAYLREHGLKVAYLHSEIKSLERLKIIRDLRTGKYDILVGINLLREGLDIPEVSLVIILDADKTGFLRSTRSLIQTIGRAARNENGEVIMYADNMTEQMDEAIKETNRRRLIQEEYNKENNIIPHTIRKEIFDVISISKDVDELENNGVVKELSKDEIILLLNDLEEKMYEYAKNLDFENASICRDQLFELKAKYKIR